MTENLYLAKSNPRETIIQHTDLLLDNLELLNKLYPDLPVDWEMLRLMVEFHDLGKMNPQFQNKLYQKLKLPQLPLNEPVGDEFPHGNLSVALLDLKALRERYSREDLNIICQAIYHHHPRHMAECRQEEFKEFLKSNLQPQAAAYPFPPSFFNSSPKAAFRKYIASRIGRQNGDNPEANRIFYKYALHKGLLHRLDYAASAHIPVEEPVGGLENKTNAYLEKLGGPRDIQRHLRDRQHQNNVIVASTGIGKTEAALLWIGDNKGFFTLPLRVSINAIHQRIKQNIGFQQAALLHSDALAVMIKDQEQDQPFVAYTKARQLSMPLTVTTVDQLFKFVFKEETFEMTLATLSYSKIVIDEIQMYSPQIVACIVKGLRFIAEAGGQWTILTATFPEVLRHFMRREQLEFDYEEFIIERTRHHMKIHDTDLPSAIDDIVEAAKTRKVLVIANTVKQAQKIFSALGDIPGKFLLHSRFIKKDRSALEQRIMEFSEQPGARGVWVTTQVVEASLDVDFDILFTELSTVDGLFQRMGRCYRKRELTDHRPNIHVFTKASGVGSIIDRDIFHLSLDALRPHEGRLLTESTKLDIVKQVYALDKIKETDYYRSIQSSLEFLDHIPAYEMKRDEVDEKFRNIRNLTCIPRSVYNQHLPTIEHALLQLQTLGFSPDQRRQRIEAVETIKALTVDVPLYLKKAVVDQLSVNKYTHFNIIDLRYDPQLGLTNDKDQENFL